MRGMGIGGRYRLIGIGVALWSIAGAAWADGGFIGKQDLREPEQKAAILFADGVEDLIIQVQYDGAVGDFAWLVPLPSKPEVSVADGAIFGELLDYSSERHSWVVEDLSGQGKHGFRGWGFGGIGESGGVTVHERKRVGVYDVAVLEADTADDLVRWCDGNGYKVSEKAREVLGFYVDRGWIFTAMRIHPEEQVGGTATALETGTIQAMRFTFPTDEAIYPLRISSINRGGSDVLLYLLADDTLVHPALAQRDPAPLDQFERLRALSGAASAADWRKQFDNYFDESKSTYRHVAPVELKRTRGAFPRWGNSALHLTALQQFFEREAMEADLVFKAPERWELGRQIELIETSVASLRRWADPLLLRMPEAFAASLEVELARSDLNPHASSLISRLRLALQLDGDLGKDALLMAARHPLPDVRADLTNCMERAWFIREEGRLPYDPISEGPRCDRVHEHYVYQSGDGVACHHRLRALPGAPGHVSVVVLAELFRSDEPNLDVAKMLVALDTEESMTLLFEAARGELDQDGGRIRNGRQEMALMALRHSSRPELAGLYRTLYSRHRDFLNEREIASCLVGLWTLNDASTDTLVRQIEGHCLASQMPTAAGLARNLLVNRLRARAPIVYDDMTLAELEREMGGRGVIVNRLTAGGEEVVQYGWETGVATVKSDVVVKWKPSGV